MITLKTTRLRLRPFVESDLKNLIELDHDLEVMKYLGGKITPLEEIQKILPVLIERQTRWLNYGTWCADLISTGENIGWFTLKPVPTLNDEFEVGYRLKKRFWGHGYATEGSRFLVEYGFETLKLPKIIGLTDLNNKASQNVLIKSGLERVADIPSPFASHFIGAITAKFEMLKPN
ncbi:MAG: GNAT family N-acetyltransferase [Pseudobdellovibrio sp.]